MAPRTYVQRAVTRAKRRNARVVSALPLFAVTGTVDQFLTTPDRELDRIYQIETSNFWWFARMRENDSHYWVLAVQFRCACKQMASDVQFAEFERQARWYPHTSAYLCEFWRHCASEVGVCEFSRL